MKEEKTKDIARKKERSTAYPAIPLESAIEAMVELTDNLGHGPFSREAAAQALGYKGVSGASATKIAAIAHFGLLTKQGNAYTQSALARRIVAPKSEEDKYSAIVEALHTPKLYSQLLARYAGQALPSMLSNILFHEFGITLGSSKEVVEIFKNSAEFAGMLKNGVLQSVTTEKKRDEVVDGLEDVKNVEPRSVIASKGHFPVQLPSGLIVVFPQELSYNFGLGEFAEQLQNLEAKAKQIQQDAKLE